ncbi:hypothetical protein NC797_15545 [Aquibacillus sp. 3ASR75-11]|uniref:YneQ n=1 Tax=Terrihalobacillus insolitus TaxID=2950438 RepID=A0A9X4ANK4_9BACI|nr:hypothetical protein [Terrihalobacillus insolitus]MDC3415027.1 hypothetical protein [Terrihalobacillus insolitus]MDC3425919.1 hypothetical protein [Terrihalobacillus insolitus]
MAFGVKRNELEEWKDKVRSGEIAFLTHYWLDPRFPGCDTVTKVGCKDLKRLKEWGKGYGLKPGWIDHHKEFPHFDLFGDQQITILKAEKQLEQLNRFHSIR